MVIQENISLRHFNTFGISAMAREFVSFSTIDDLVELISSRYSLHTPLILGGGSNILLTKNLDNLVMKNDIRGIEVVKEDDQHVYVRAGAGENWHQLVMFCVDHNYAGVENLSLIPGNVGASPMQNIGAYGVEIKDVFHELEAVHLRDHTVQKFSLETCEFGYRDSVFKGKYKNNYIITHVTYRLNKIPVFHTNYVALQQELEKSGITELTIKAISDAVIRIRTSKLPDPKEVGNAGSFFKNPAIPNSQFLELKDRFPTIVAFPSGAGDTKLAAGWMIEQCGWKGYRKGDAGCYPKQALVLVNYGNASGIEILQLSEEIIQSVKEKFGVELEREVNII